MKKDTFANRLKIAMQRKSYRQVDVINKAKNTNYGVQITKTDMSQYLSGKTKFPRVDKLLVLSKILNVSEPWLLGYDVDEQIEET